MKACIQGIESYLPADIVTNADLNRRYPEWSVDRIAQKTGIEQRHIAASDEHASDLAFHAAQKLFASGVCTAAEIDYILLCTQSPDYVLPTTACLLQQRLGIGQNAGALDFNLGCSGYLYGLGIAHGLISTEQARKVLLLTAETYSKYLDPGDRSSVTIFGDGAAATLIVAAPDDGALLRPAYVYGTDGAGADHLIVRGGASRKQESTATLSASGCEPLWMNGPEIFHFTLRVVPDCVRNLLQKAGMQVADVDLFVFHQANKYMLDHLRKKLEIPEDRFYLSLASCGNTVSSTIPIALESACREGRINAGSKVMLVGFGVGLSWGATLLTWPFLGVTGQATLSSK